ncbi:tetratricopeptide repeat protein [Shimia abyssi]|uniref:Tetratricopeptide repeat protein n=1 Tax=Shimia abyssi TaxID=1662395 RepID=A0A2P8FC64_9RHOB|nr:hypothetical protein [Shimia abyssi]PSL19321.1 hypothetical protein CLV88_10633 [Shimia abyssi]
MKASPKFQTLEGIFAHATVASATFGVDFSGIFSTLLNTENQSDNAVSPSQIQAALADLLASERFANADRLCKFLQYVIDETLEGRKEMIRAKSIALDVYGYRPDEVEQRESVVRVDAGRVRRKLYDYHTNEGKDAAVRIELPKGGYVPTFSQRPDSVQTHVETPPRKKWPWGIGLATACIVVVLASVFLAERTPQNTARNIQDETALRLALYDTAPHRLQAMRLAQEGRDLIFPATSQEQLEAAAAVFNAVLKLDDTYAGGHAGLSQVLAMFSLLSPDTVTAEPLAGKANALSDKALELAPSAAWSMSAKSWSALATKDYAAARFWTDKALDRAPDDPHILEFAALVLLYSGAFDDVLQRTGTDVISANPKQGFVFHNARGSALFHLKNHEAAAQAFETSIATGGPLGPVSVAYLMASYHYLGQDVRAAELVRLFNQHWPQNRIDLLLMRLFQDAVHGQYLSDGMTGAGWIPPN